METQENKVVGEGALAKAEYFSVSTTRLMVLSILTFNLYPFFWFYRNWQAVKKSQGTDIYPLLRAIFSIFFCNNLFVRVLRSAKDNGYADSYSPGWLAAAYIALLFAGNALGRVEIAGGTYLLSLLVLLVLTPLPLLPVQRAINYSNAKIGIAQGKANAFTTGEIIVIGIGAILLGLTVFGSLMPV